MWLYIHRHPLCGSKVEVLEMAEVIQVVVSLIGAFCGVWCMKKDFHYEEFFHACIDHFKYLKKT